MNKNTKSSDTKKLVGIAMFAALAYGVTFVFRIPVMFLTFDAKDTLITIAALMYGPVSGIVISLLTALIELITISGTGVYGFIMNFASSATFSATAALVYKYKRNVSGAIFSFYTASIAMVTVMMCMNIFVTPYYMGVARSAVMDMIPKLFLPFNIAKALLNSALAMMLYKPISNAMSHIGLNKKKMGTKFNKNSVIILIVGSIALALSLVILFIIS